MFSSKKSSAAKGSWIKDIYRKDRSLGIVISVDEQTNMMLVRFPKGGNDTWVVWQNHGHYKVINP